MTLYRRGFEDCVDVVQELIAEAKDLTQAKENISKVLAVLKEKKVRELRAELDL